MTLAFIFPEVFVTTFLDSLCFGSRLDLKPILNLNIWAISKIASDIDTDIRSISTEFDTEMLNVKNTAYLKLKFTNVLTDLRNFAKFWGGGGGGGRGSGDNTAVVHFISILLGFPIESSGHEKNITSV